MPSPSGSSERPALGARSSVEQDRPPLVPVARWVCCHCGGTGLTGDGATCPLCDGFGHD